MHTIGQTQRTLDAQEKAKLFAIPLQLSSHSQTRAYTYYYFAFSSIYRPI